MVLFNYTTKELTAKIVYYGPGLCGKTTNLQFVYDGLPGHVKKGKMLSLATKTDRTLFFDFLPIELGRIRGMRTRVQLYTVPGQVFYNSTRKLVLKGADGLVFVADSQQKMMESNIESYKNLEENLQEIGLKLDEMPLVMQFNKRDLPNLASVEEMNTLINRHNAPFYEAVATTGIGVEDTLKAITKLVLNNLAVKYHLGASGPEKAEREDILVAKSHVSPALSATGGSSHTLRGPVETRAPLQAESEGDFGAMSNIEKPDAYANLPSPFSNRAENRDDAEDLEILDLEDELGMDTSPTPIASEVAAENATPEDLSSLLEEIPEDGPEEVLEVLEDAAPLPAPSVFASKSEPVREIGLKPANSFAPPAVSPEIRRPAVQASRTMDTSAQDPLGIMAARHAELPEAPTIQIGAVTPGKQHQITVPLEMSVEGRKVRLQLRMTLTLSN
jgi:signal recognition particle receptor subunit beta